MGLVSFRGSGVIMMVVCVLDECNLKCRGIGCL